MRTKQIMADATSVNKVTFRDKYIELVLIAWVSIIVFVRCMGWDNDSMPMLAEVLKEMLQFAIVAVGWRRLHKKLPRRCWQAVTIYTLALAAFSLLVSAGYYFWANEKFSTAMFIVTAIFLLPAASGAYAWHRRVVKGREIIFRRELIAKRKRKI